MVYASWWSHTWHCRAAEQLRYRTGPRICQLIYWTSWRADENPPAVIPVDVLRMPAVPNRARRASARRQNASWHRDISVRGKICRVFFIVRDIHIEAAPHNEKKCMTYLALTKKTVHERIKIIDYFFLSSTCSITSNMIIADLSQVRD